MATNEERVSSWYEAMGIKEDGFAVTFQCFIKQTTSRINVHFTELLVS